MLQSYNGKTQHLRDVTDHFCEIRQRTKRNFSNQKQNKYLQNKSDSDIWTTSFSPITQHFDTINT